MRMSRGPGRTQLRALTYLLNRYGTTAPEPVAMRELLEHARLQPRSLDSLSRAGLIRAHLSDEGEVYWVLTRKALKCRMLRAVSSYHARHAYWTALNDAGM